MRRHLALIGVGLAREGKQNLGTKAEVPRFCLPSLARTRADQYHMPTAIGRRWATPAREIERPAIEGLG
jgi:hypothetical protein